MWPRQLKISADILIQSCKIFLVLVSVCFAGCLSYEEVMYRTESRFSTRGDDVKLVRPPEEKSTDGHGDAKSGKNDDHRLVIRVKYSRYYVLLPGYSAAAKINRKGVELAVAGKFSEADILFNQLVEEFPDEAAGYNNLGLVHEVSGRREKAFTMLTKACILDPENYYFRKNFLYMHEKNQ